MILAAQIFTACCVALLLFAHVRGSRRLMWVAKPAASAGFVAATLAAGALQGPYGRWVLGAQLLGWVGDVLLISKQRLPFVLGLGVFLIGHLGFAAAFFSVAESGSPVGGATLFALAIPGFFIHQWLMPHVPGALRTPVRAYIIIISIMVAAGVAAWSGHPDGTILVLGCVLFYLSDLCVARQRFVTPGLGNQLLGLPLYYAAQLLLAATVAAV